jgi:hypothetical protein
MTSNKYDLEEVLDAVMVAERKPSYEALIRWIKRYPGFRKELENFFVAWSEAEMAKYQPDTGGMDDEAIAERAVKRVLAKLRTQNQRSRS